MKRLTAQQQETHTQFDADHPRSTCWGCRSDGEPPETLGRTHHIVGRGKECECRENYGRLCDEHHALIHSATQYTLVVMLALKSIYDGIHYDREYLLVTLKGVAETAVTEGEVNQIRNRLMDGATVESVIEGLVNGKDSHA